MTVQPPAPPALPEPVEALTRRLRLPYLRSAAPEVLATARSQRWDPAEVVRVLLSEEAAGRDQATTRMRRKASGLPAGKTFDAWDPAASPIPAAAQQALRTLTGEAPNTRASRRASCSLARTGLASRELIDRDAGRQTTRRWRRVTLRLYRPWLSSGDEVRPYLSETESGRTRRCAQSRAPARCTREVGLGARIADR